MFLFGGKSKSRAADEAAAKEAAGLTPAEFSSAAATALAAAATGSPAAKPAAPSTGRLLRGSHVAIQLDELRPNEVVTELKVQPITLVKTDFKLEQTQLVAVSDTYICYGLKAGHIRALDRNTGGRALFKGHPAGVSWMAFFSAGHNLLASVSAQGDIAVRRVSDKGPADGDESTIQGTLLMAAQLPAGDMQGAAASPYAPVTLAWHPTVPQILAAGAGSSVHIYEVPTAADDAAAAPAPSQPGISYSIAGSSGQGAAITSLGFTPSGDLLVAGDSAGGVHAWWLDGEEPTAAPLLSWRPFEAGGADAAAAAGGVGIGSVRVLQQAPDGSSLLLTGSATNSTLRLWALPAAAALVGGGQAPVQLQSVSFQGKQAAGAVFCHVAVQPELQLVVLADTGRKQVYTLHYGPGSSSGAAPATAADAVFDFAAFFSVRQPILSLSIIPEGADGADEQQLLLYCVQTEAIQQYLLSTPMCMPPAAGTEAEADAESVGEAAPADTPAAEAEATPAAVPPPAKLPTPGLLAARAAAHKAAAGDAPSADASTASPVTPAPQQQEPEEEEGAAEDSSSSSTATGGAASKRAAPMPPMPTSSLMHSAEKAPPAAEQVDSPAAKAEPVLAREGDAVAAAAAAATTAAAAGAAAAVSREPAAAAAAPAAAGVSSGEVAALQQQMAQLLQLQERMAAQLQTTSQQTVAGVKAEVGRSLKSTEAALLKQVEAVLKASAKKAEEERRKAAAKERQELERLMAEQLNQVSVGLLRDMSKVVADTAREQARAAVNATVNAVTPAVASAVAASLQQELASSAGAGGSLQVALEQSLASSLAGPLHEALRNNFDVSLIPAFERATRVMFSQVESAFNAWLADSSKVVSAAQADAGASLNSALTQLQSVVGSMRHDLGDTAKALSRLASSTAGKAQAAPAAGGAAAATAGGSGRASGGGAAAAQQQDPRAEIAGLLSSRQFETALVKALNTADLDIVLWTCQQMDPALVLGGASMNLSQTTLLSLVHQLSANLSGDANTALRLSWLAEAAPVVDPHDPMTEPHLRSVLSGVMSSLKQLVMSLPQTDAMAKKGKITLHLFNSLLHQ